MSVNMVVRKDAFDGFIMPVVYGAISLGPTWVTLYFRGPETIAFFLSSPARQIVGLVLLAALGWAAVKIGQMVVRAWRHRDIPIIDMDDEWVTYRTGRALDMQKVLYKDMLRAYLLRRGEDSATLVIELVTPAGFMMPVPDPIRIDLDGTNAQPEDVCDAIAGRIVQQNPCHGQSLPQPQFS